MRLQTIAILILTLAGFALRLHYLITTHPFFDEYTTVLAARQILKEGWPHLPSGLFYEHGLLSTYLIAPFTALFINLPLADWQPAHWGLMLARWPSALLGTLTIPLIYGIGRRINGQWPATRGGGHRWSMVNPPSSIHHLPSSCALLAAGLFAFSPEGMVWGGRARMYALATLLVLLLVYWAYRGAVYPASARYRWGAMITLLAALLTQFGVMVLIPPLVVGMQVVGWLSWRSAGVQRSRGAGEQGSNNFSPHDSPLWFLRPAIILEAMTLVIIIGIAIWIKRLGQPVGMATLGSEEGGSLLGKLLDTVIYQTTFSLNGPAILNFLAEQFGPSHLFWLTLVVMVGTVVSLFLWINQWRSSKPTNPSGLFLWIVFGLIVLEMVTLLDAGRQNPRYLVMYLPLFYLIAAKMILDFGFWILDFTFYVLHPRSSVVIALILLFIFTILSLPDLRVALVTPEPAYETAFKFLHDNWQPGDALLTMNTPAAALYQSQVDGFTVQAEADQFLLNKNTTPVDRWVGTPWVGTATDFNIALNAHERVWFVIDSIRQPVYFQGDWQAIVNTQMEQVWSQDNALIYRTRPDRVPLPTHPATLVKATLGDTIELTGYTLQIPAPEPVTVLSSSTHFNLQSPLSNLKLTFFWQPLRPLSEDYTIFLHLRNDEGATVAQRDSLPLEGTYPTSRWQAGETIIDPLTLSLPANLPPGQYTLWAGMYQLETLQRLPVANDTSGENAVLLGDINFE